MQHVRVAKYRIVSGDIDELTDIARDGMLKIFKDHPGFISYGLADCGDGTVLSISHWETHDEAEAAAGFAREWVAANLGGRVELLDNMTADYRFLD
jgi:heme-degrading monooxygenase HmoA